MVGIRRLDLYILGEFLFSFLVSFLFFFFIFFVNQLLVMAEEIFSRNVAFGDVLRFILFSLPSIVALAFPFGSLVGGLMAVGRLSSDNEILALRASGVSLQRILAPLLVAGVLLSSFSFVMNDYFLPLGNIRLGAMFRKILYTNPRIELEPYSIKRYQDTVIITGAIDGNLIEEIAIIDRREDKRKRVITARAGSLAESVAQKGVISLRLEEVFTHVSEKEGEDTYEYSSSAAMIYNILLRDFTASFVNPGPREMSSVDVWKEIRKMEAARSRQAAEQRRVAQKSLFTLAMELRALEALPPAGRQQRVASLGVLYREHVKERDKDVVDRNLQLYLLEFHKKFSIPAACLVFILFGFPVGLVARRSGRTVGFAVGLLMSAVYWGFLFTGHTLGIRMQLSPPLAMWLPNLVVLAAGGVLFLTRVRR
ncbi:MAG: LptF/LptG family permease [Spirochaetales bacterium]|nr:LptF/LptG family permease [Spirochaetales bacterium]